MAKISIEEKRAEAVSRMKKLGIYPETIRQFEQENLVSISEPPFGAFFWADADDLERIREFEKEYNALVYVVVRSYTEMGKLDSYLYVSDYTEEWAEDRNDIAAPESGVMAYTYNNSLPDFSEFGSIGVQKTIGAGLRRIF